MSFSSSSALYTSAGGASIHVECSVVLMRVTALVICLMRAQHHAEYFADSAAGEAVHRGLHGKPVSRDLSVSVGHQAMLRQYIAHNPGVTSSME